MIVCGDSHTSTHGAFGAFAFGIGTSEVEHVLATQTIVQSRAEDDGEVRIDGPLPAGVAAKDIILGIIGRIGIAGATGHAIEYTGKAIRALSMEGRMTVCNMSIEAGARAGMIAPDEKTFNYLQGRRFAPKGCRLGRGPLLALGQLPSDEGAVYDRVGGDRGGRAAALTSPGAPTPEMGGASGDSRSRARPRDLRRREPTARRDHAGAGVHGAAAADANRRGLPSTGSSSARARTRASRTYAPRRRESCAAARSTAACAPWSCPAPSSPQDPGRAGGAGPGLPRRRLRVARGGLLDVPRA